MLSALFYFHLFLLTYFPQTSEEVGLVIAEFLYLFILLQFYQMALITFSCPPKSLNQQRQLKHATFYKISKDHILPLE